MGPAPSSMRAAGELYAMLLPKLHPDQAGADPCGRDWRGSLRRGGGKSTGASSRVQGVVVTLTIPARDPCQSNASAQEVRYLHNGVVMVWTRPAGLGCQSRGVASHSRKHP